MKYKVDIRHLPYVILGVIIVVFLFTHWSLNKDLQSIPTCIYRCDYYFEHGIAMDVQNNPFNSWQSSSHAYVDHLSSLPKTHMYLVAATSVLTGYSGNYFWKNYLALSYVLIIIGLLSWFFLYAFVFKNNWIALPAALISYSFGSYFKYSTSANVILPLLLLSLLYTFEQKSLLRKSLFSLATVLLSVAYMNTHAMSLFVLVFLFGCYFFVYIFNYKKIKESIISCKTLILGCIAFFSVALSLLMGWWWRVIFEYGGQTNAFLFDIHVDLTSLANYVSFFFSYTRS
jgi:hypothetical protein